MGIRVRDRPDGNLRREKDSSGSKFLISICGISKQNQNLSYLQETGKIMDRLPGTKRIFAILIVLLTFSPLFGEINGDKLELKIKMLKVEEIPEFLDEAYKLEDTKLFEILLQFGSKNLIQHFKIRLGSTNQSR